MGGSGSALFSLQGFACGYGGKPVVQGIDLELFRGDFYALIGINGSGKSTFLRTLVGLLPPAGGRWQSAAVGGALPPLGYIPQNEKLDSIFPISVAEVVVMGAYSHLGPGRMVKAEHRGAAQAALREMGVSDLAARRFSELSGGQKQRVLLARALMTNPAILVLDEPTSGVDPEAERAIMSRIRTINERGVAVLMASHNLDLVREFASGVIWFREGGVEIGAPGEILEKAGEARRRANYL